MAIVTRTGSRDELERMFQRIERETTRAVRISEEAPVFYLESVSGQAVIVGPEELLSGRAERREEAASLADTARSHRGTSDDEPQRVADLVREVTPPAAQAPGGERKRGAGETGAQESTDPPRSHR